MCLEKMDKVMVDKNETENKSDGMMDKRIQRRRLLKTGALAAPIALTLHGGVPLAHADSSGSCILKLIEIANDSGNPHSGELQVPINPNNGQVAQAIHGHAQFPDLADYPVGTTLVPFDGTYEHWSFVGSAANRFGFSCVSSLTSN